MARKNSRRRPGTGPTKGDLTRQAVISHALQIAGHEGLSAISIGGLAKELGMSKSGLFLHFGSKEKLELAVIEQARALFFNHVVVPIELKKLRGIERLWALCDSWLDFVERGPLPGGYFFSGAFFQTAKQNGPVPRQIRGVGRDWVDALEVALREAKRNDELKKDIDTQEVAFELNGILIGAEWCRLMTGRDFRNARSAILSTFRNLATDEIPERAFESLKTWKAYLGNRDDFEDR